MALSPEELERIALLARLELTPEEKERFRIQLSSILDHVARLQKLDTAHILPTSSVLPPRSRLREDVRTPSLTREEVLRNAADTHKGQFRVPPVLDR